MKAFAALLGREIRLAARHGGDTFGALLFFFVAGALFPLAIGPSPQVLANTAPGIVWVCALLAALLPLIDGSPVVAALQAAAMDAALEDGSCDEQVLR